MTNDAPQQLPIEEKLLQELDNWRRGAPHHPLLEQSDWIVKLALSSGPQIRQAALNEANLLLGLMPRHATNDLFLDVALIVQVMVLFKTQSEPRFIIPVYDVGPGRSWRHEERLMPSNLGAVSAHLVYIDRDPCVPLVDFRSYSWFVHELMHTVLAKYFSIFAGMQSLVAERVQQWRLTGLASRDPASKQLSADFERYWSPREGQDAWPHEIAVDALGMVLLGPAYAEAFWRHYQEHAPTTSAYFIEPSHIPVELRTQALITIGEDLGWESEMKPLRELQAVWAKQWPEAARASRYRTLRDAALIAETQRAARSLCAELHVPTLTRSRLAEIMASSDDVHSLTGTDLIIAAWGVAREQTEHQYRDWASRVVQSYAEDA